MTDYVTKIAGFCRSLLGRSENQDVDIESIAVDIHGHWLPGVDDGAKSMTESIEMIEGLQKMGFKRIIATPHINKHMFDNDPELLIKRYFDLVNHLRTRKLEIKLALAAEYMLDSGFLSHLEDRDLLSLDSRFVLVELPPWPDWTSLKHLLYIMHRQGYKPLLAHPERHSFLQNSKDGYAKLRDAGCSFQLNMLSLVGTYGNRAQKTANELTRKGWYEFVGTDIHSSKQLPRLQQVVLTGNFQNEIFL